LRQFRHTHAVTEQRSCHAERANVTGRVKLAPLLLLLLLAACPAPHPVARAQHAPASPRPGLVVLVIVDQFPRGASSASGPR
jgi:hypothetical protein